MNVKSSRAIEFSSHEEIGKVKYRRETVCSSDDEEANADLNLEIIKKAMLRKSRNNSRDDEVSEIVTNLKDGRKKKEKNKSRKSNGMEVAEAAVDIVKDVGDGTDEGKPETNEAIEISDKSIETNPIDMSDDTILRKLLRGPRYFDPSNNSWGACYNCGEEGHTAVNCTSAKRKKPCFVCGSFEHNAKQCTKGRDCYICKQQGHRAKDCPEKNQSTKICLRCGDEGHDMFVCRNNYFPDDLKYIQCYVCQRFGHLCCVKCSDSGPREVSCYRCGLSGHTGLACTRSRTDINGPGSAQSCYKCGIEGHFARECPNMTKACTESRVDINGPGSAQSCYNCGFEGHFARECPSLTKACTWSRTDINGPYAAQSCYKCGLEGHFSRECPSLTKACIGSRTYINGPGVAHSCNKCGFEGHFARECHFLTKACKSSRIDINGPGSVQSCYKFGFEGHFAREYPSLAKAYTGSRTDINGPGSAQLCYRCGFEGHFARECPSLTKSTNKIRELSSPEVRSSKKRKDKMEVKSPPHDPGNKYKRQKIQHDELRSPAKIKHRGGWLTERPGDFHSTKSKPNNWRSTVVSNRGSKISSWNDSYLSSSSSRKRHNNYNIDSPSIGSGHYYQHRFSASLYDNSNNDWSGRSYNRW